MINAHMRDRFENGEGFIAALDQSGGSTPKALAAYGVDESRYANDEEMFQLIHAARDRIVTSPSFLNDRIIAAILFQGYIAHQIEGVPVAEYLWEAKGIVPILKIDKGLEEEAAGVKLMKDIPGLDGTLANAASGGLFGTKQRSVIRAASSAGVTALVAQQFDVARRVLEAGLVPILEPEVDIHVPDKAKAESLLKEQLLKGLDSLGEGERVGIKISIPSINGFYSDLIDHPKVARVVALSGGYVLDEATERLARNPTLIASFSRALLDGLTEQQSDAEFNSTLDLTAEKIYQASIV